LKVSVDFRWRLCNDVGMRTALYQDGQMIYFRLDNNPAHEGEGTFVRGWRAAGKYKLIVELTQPCKDAAAGTEIVIDNDEVY